LTHRYKHNNQIENSRGRKKKNRGDESIHIIIHIYMEMSQGNSLCSYLKQAKMSFFFFYKIGGQEDGTDPARRGWYQWEGKEVGA
jgi:hypothetical protein